MQKGTILSEAEALVQGERQKQYGEPIDHFTAIADMWSRIIKAPVTPRQVALCMISTKIVREAFRPSQDNRRDIAGYVLIADRLTADEEAQVEAIEIGG